MRPSLSASAPLTSPPLAPKILPGGNTLLTRPEAGRDHARAARNLIPLIEAAAPRIESEGGLPDDLLSALHHERLFHMLVPKDVGGEEVDLLTFFRAVEAVASADASAGWCVGQGCGVSMASAYLDRAVALEIFDGPQAVVASAPTIAMRAR